MTLKADQFISYSLRGVKEGEKIANVLAAAINAVDPAVAVKNQMAIEADEMIVGSQSYRLVTYKNIYIVGAGKAGFPMATAAAEVLGDRLTRGVVLVKDQYIGTDDLAFLDRISFIEAGHPLPDERGIAGAQRISQLLQSSEKEDLVICLISGGGSALLTSPSDGIELEDLRDLMRLLLQCGAKIQEINTLRKHLEGLKGGQLVRLASPARVISLILSDVVGDSLETIASGPTTPDSSTFEDAQLILEKYKLIDRVPQSIINHVHKGLNREIEETPKPGERSFERTQNLVIGTNKIAAQAAIEEAESKGFNTLLLTTSLQGEARHAGQFLVSIARELKQEYPAIPSPACIVCGGETTVVIRGNGMGGRNMELALGAVEPLEGLPDTILVTLATDGTDGPTDAAGAVVTGQTYRRAMELDLNPDDYLNNNDSYRFFQPLDDLLKPGPTFTNVNDLTFIFSY